MRTSKPFSTVSYNTESFLYDTLTDLLNRHQIDFFAFIEHLPEEDEKKKHRHVFVIPSHQVDTSYFIEKFEEPDFQNSLPLKCIPCKSSKFVDWYLYALHDPDYLAKKMEVKKYHYQKDDIIVSDSDFFAELIHTSDFIQYKRHDRFRECCLSGIPFRELVTNGFVPIQLINQYDKAYQYIYQTLFQNLTPSKDESPFGEDPAGPRI